MHPYFSQDGKPNGSEMTKKKSDSKITLLIQKNPSNHVLFSKVQLWWVKFDWTSEHFDVFDIVGTGQSKKKNGKKL